MQAGNSLAAALLLLIGRKRGALDVAAPRQGDHHILIRNEVLNVNAAQFIHEHFRAAGRGIGSLDFIRFIAQHAAQHGRILQDGSQVGDKTLKLGILVLQLVAFQPGETLQTHIQNALGLNFRKAESLHQAVAGVQRRGRCLDQRHDLVDDVQGLEQPFHDMRARFGLVEIEAGSADEPPPACD